MMERFTETKLHESLSVRSERRVEMLFREVRLFDPVADIDQPGDLLIRAGLIEKIADADTLDAPDGVEVIDSSGMWVFPGFVDPHVHLRTPGREDEEDVDSGTRAAAAGGFCCVLAMPNTLPVVDNASVLRSLREQAEVEARVPVGFLAAATKGQRGRELTEMAELAQEGAVGFTDDGNPISEARIVRLALQYQRLSDKVLALHEEDLSLSGEGVMHEGEVSAVLGLDGIPSVAESSAVQRDAALAGYEDGRCHVLHVSSKLSLDAVAEAKEKGFKITAEVTPHHLTLTDEVVRTLDTRYKMNPPLRTEEDRKALIEGLRSGVIDCIATDHAPHATEEKERPFEQAPMGVTGLETAFSALYTELVGTGQMDLGTLIEKMGAGSDVYDLPRPSLSPGNPCNLCLVDLDREWVVGESGYESRSDNSCFADRTLKGKVIMTLAAGQEAYRERSFAIHEAG